jgi:hypothetical protein
MLLLFKIVNYLNQVISTVNPIKEALIKPRKHPLPSGEGWGEGMRIKDLLHSPYSSRQLLLHCPIACIHAVVPEGEGTYSELA